jgi:tetratricopeptide (TPR) repeat protein
MQSRKSVIGQTAVRKDVYKLLCNCVVDEQVIARLRSSQRAFATECELWDYKKDVGTTPADEAELVRDVVAFHNSYGGYIVIGVEEAKDVDGEFRAVGVSEGTLRQSALRDKITAATGSRIDVLCKEFRIDAQIFSLICVPKRQDAVPVSFLRNGADYKPGKPVYRAGTIPWRASDSCRTTTSRDDLAFVLGPRVLDFLEEGEAAVPGRLAEPLENNLPDRSLICPRFIGRSDIVDQLWSWLADPLSFVRVLAGDGGKGKTSIAYQFAAEVTQRRVGQIDQVIWLTAKERQFVGYQNEAVSLGDASYKDMTSLLKAIAKRSGMRDEELDNATSESLKAIAHSALNTVPALVVIDDVDSCETNEQKRILELAAQIGSRRSRFLLTTRANMSYSSDICIRVPGLDGAELALLVNGLCDSLKMQRRTEPEIRRIHEATEGSPLLTESVVRLINLGMTTTEAIDEWRGQAGMDARAAVLQKEISRLGVDAKRVLLSAAIMGESSRTELRQLTAYEDLRLSDALEELLSLFLIGAPRITADEPRFAVSTITRSLALQQAAELAIDHARMAKYAKEMRRSPTQKARAASDVGAAINQANAQLREGKVADALRTIDASLKKVPLQRDLLSMRGRVLASLEPPDLDRAREAFAAAYKAGCVREELFRDWFRAEYDVGNPGGAVEVAEYALARFSEEGGWFWRRGRAKAKLGNARRRAGDKERAYTTLNEAADDFAEAISRFDGPWRQDCIAESTEVHDLMISVASECLHTNRAAHFDACVSAINRGDFRRSVYTYMVRALRDLLKTLSKPVIAGSPEDAFVGALFRRAQEVVKKRPSREGDTFRLLYMERLTQLSASFECNRR